MGKSRVVGQQRSIDGLSKRNVEGISSRHIEAQSPRGHEEGSQPHPTKMPATQPIDCIMRPSLADSTGNDLYMSDDPENFGIEVFGNPEGRFGWKQGGQEPASLGTRQDLDASRGVDNHLAGHVSGERSLRRTSLASSEVMMGSSFELRISSKKP